MQHARLLSGGAIIDDVTNWAETNLPAMVEGAVTNAAAGTSLAPVVGPAISVAKFAYNKIGQSAGVRNLFQSTLKASGRANPLARPLTAGEMHAVEGPGSRYPASNHNFTGPGTDVLGRLRRGDLPVNDVDKVSMRHDVAFLNAKTAADVRKADLDAVNGFNHSNQDPLVAKLASQAIKAKMALEDRGLLDPMRYTGNKSQASGAGVPGGNLIALAKKVARARRKEKRKHQKQNIIHL